MCCHGPVTGAGGGFAAGVSKGEGRALDLILRDGFSGGIKKRSSTSDLAAFTAENQRPLSGKCSGSIGITPVFQGGSAKNTSNF
jgi:hypothetical protein